MTYNIPLISPNCKPHQNKSLAVSPTETDKTAEKKIIWNNQSNPGKQ